MGDRISRRSGGAGVLRRPFCVLMDFWLHFAQIPVLLCDFRWIGHHAGFGGGDFYVYNDLGVSRRWI